MSIPEIKACIRRQTLRQRSHLSSDIKTHAARKICDQIKGLMIYNKSDKVAFYVAVDGEVDLSSLWTPLPQAKICYFPKLFPSKALLFLPLTDTAALYTNPWGIPEPSTPIEQAVDINLIQIIFIPLVAFDMQGTRLGMGGGYYDRCLAQNERSIRIGVAYEFQKQTYIPAEPWDKPLHAVITETSTYWFSNPDLL